MPARDRYDILYVPQVLFRTFRIGQKFLPPQIANLDEDAGQKFLPPQIANLDEDA